MHFHDQFQPPSLESPPSSTLLAAWKNDDDDDDHDDHDDHDDDYDHNDNDDFITILPRSEKYFVIDEHHD